MHAARRGMELDGRSRLGASNAGEAGRQILPIHDCGSAGISTPTPVFAGTKGANREKWAAKIAEFLDCPAESTWFDSALSARPRKSHPKPSH